MIEMEGAVQVNEDAELVRIVESSGLEKTQADYVLDKFKDHFRVASEWERKAHAIVVTSAGQVAEMKMAREGRLFLKSRRVEIERTRKDMKEASLRQGRAIDGIANVRRLKQSCVHKLRPSDRAGRKPSASCWPSKCRKRRRRRGVKPKHVALSWLRTGRSSWMSLQGFEHSSVLQ